MFIATVGLKADVQNKDWIIDSGASHHMTFEKYVLHSYEEFEQLDLVMGVQSQH